MQVRINLKQLSGWILFSLLLVACGTPASGQTMPPAPPADQATPTLDLNMALTGVAALTQQSLPVVSSNPCDGLTDSSPEDQIIACSHTFSHPELGNRCVNMLPLPGDKDSLGSKINRYCQAYADSLNQMAKQQTADANSTAMAATMQPLYSVMGAVGTQGVNAVGTMVGEINVTPPATATASLTPPPPPGTFLPMVIQMDVEQSCSGSWAANVPNTTTGELWFTITCSLEQDHINFTVTSSFQMWSKFATFTCFFNAPCADFDGMPTLKTGTAPGSFIFVKTF